jgi:glycosyltransferase involved in cell wall biosynthesis
MRLAMIITKVDEDDSVYGANIAWIRALAERVEHLTVIGMSVGRHTLPANTTVRSLGKERGASKLGRLLALQRIMLPLVLRRRIDGIFVHQAQVWGLALFYAWPLRVPVVLFKAHGTMPPGIRRFLPFFTAVTTTTAETFVDTPKKVVVGQGIDVRRFQRSGAPVPVGEDGQVSIVSVGRLSSIRRYHVVIDAIAIVRERGRWLPTLHVYGEPYNESEVAYARELEAQIARLGLECCVVFHGVVPNAELPAVYGQSVAYLNGSLGTSALDKSMLEAMACELPLITGNPKFVELFGPHAGLLYCESEEAEALADKLEGVLALKDEERVAIGAHLRKSVVDHHNVEGLMEQVVGLIASKRGR